MEQGNVKALIDHLFSLFQERVELKAWKGQEELPFFLQNLYEFYEALLFEKRCIFMIAKPCSVLTPAAIKKHWQLVEEKYNGMCIYVQEGTSSFNRIRLIEQHVPFIIPGNQMYLPDLGIDFREHFQKRRAIVKSFRPATQAVIIYVLVHDIQEHYTPSVLAKQFGYSAMTMTRVFDELQANGIGEILYKGKERFWIYKESRQQLWEQALPFMKSPIKAKTGLGEKPPQLIQNMRAGYSALALRSMLQAPNLITYAVGYDIWCTLKERGLQEVAVDEGADWAVEVWWYDPVRISKDKMVDPFSLYLSLITDADERTQIALEEMMENIKW